MKKESLIEELQKLPEGMEVCVFDWRKNFFHDPGDGSGCGEGIYSQLEVEVHKLEGAEAKFYKEMNDKEFVPFAAISFRNDDYDDDGNCLL